jgi:hypothetical protein
MRHILYKKQFESLGVVSEIDDIVDLAKDNLEKGNKEYNLKTKLRDKNVEIQFVHNQDSEEYKGTSLHSYVQLLDADPSNLKFLISLGDLKKSTIAHEVKHVDREVARNLIANFSYYLNHVGRDAVEKMSHLLKDEESSDILYLAFYLINKDEFEAYYNEFQREIKEMVTTDMSKEQREKVIKDYLGEQDIYILYKDIDKKGGFNLESYFKDKSAMLQYLSAFNVKMDEFIEDKTEEYDDWEKIKTDDYTPSGISKLAKKVNHHLTKIAKEGLKKFDRLYITQ